METPTTPRRSTRTARTRTAETRPRSARRAVALAVLAAGAVGCAGLGGVRPGYGPLPGSVLLQLDVPPDTVVRALASAVQAARLHLKRFAPSEGYLETEWYHLDTGASGSAGPRDLDRVVKLRFFADPVAGATRLLAECVTRLVYDPSLPERELERMVAEGHPGRRLLERILSGLRESAGS